MAARLVGPDGRTPISSGKGAPLGALLQSAANHLRAQAEVEAALVAVVVVVDPSGAVHVQPEAAHPITLAHVQLALSEAALAVARQHVGEVMAAQAEAAAARALPLQVKL